MSLRKSCSIMPELEALQSIHPGRGCLRFCSRGRLLSGFSVFMALFTKKMKSPVSNLNATSHL